MEYVLSEMQVASWQKLIHFLTSPAVKISGMIDQGHEMGVLQRE
tara:strand:+ start:4356 stop:4487 length:132 start_codon:yes stop_codon:yes gene_type:complete